MGVVYKITNTVNGKVYIGKTMNRISARWSEHKSRVNTRTDKGHLYAAMRKYGIENFSIEIIDESPSEQELNSKEIEWIARLSSYDHSKGYNCLLGGDGGKAGPLAKNKQKGWRTLSVQTRQKISKANKGRKLSPEHIEKMRIAFTGRKQPRDTVERRSESNRKVWMDQERKARHAEKSRQRIADGNNMFWKHITPESIVRANESRKTWRESQDGIAFRKKISQIHTGKKNSDDIKKGWETRRANKTKLEQSKALQSAYRKSWWSIPENRERIRIKLENRRSLAAQQKREAA